MDSETAPRCRRSADGEPVRVGRRCATGSMSGMPSCDPRKCRPFGVIMPSSACRACAPHRCRSFPELRRRFARPCFELRRLAIGRERAPTSRIQVRPAAPPRAPNGRRPRRQPRPRRHETMRGDPTAHCRRHREDRRATNAEFYGAFISPGVLRLRSSVPAPPRTSANESTRSDRHPIRFLTPLPPRPPGIGPAAAHAPRRTVPRAP